ncbi:MAG: NADH-quinone oxidoreductase subunit H [Candidatus Latescibacterota bacterium]|jgi:NADH-quinone oxidoreductase subunit H|nr:MAG: NADH-quinone oxidoreductase subunit H [Candidatus Latescibacterota bacterium]
MTAFGYIVKYLLFPGFVFSAVVGLLTTWVDRKVTARVQYRVGPPWYQPFADTIKLLGKEVVVPAGARTTGFLVMPVVGLAAATLASTILWLVNLDPTVSFVGDTIVVLYVMTIPALALIIGGSASGNPLGILGASREMKLMFGYELPLVMAVLTTVVKVGSFSFEKILIHQEYNGVMLGSVSGVLAFIVAIFCAQAKLGFIPFDIPEAETEIAGGTHIEYSGAPLAVVRLNTAIMYLVMPLFIITMFWGGVSFVGWRILTSVLKYVAIVVIIVVVKNTNPRVRIDHALRFFWGPMFVLSAVALILATLGY